jgi:hypothetical protein
MQVSAVESVIVTAACFIDVSSAWKKQSIHENHENHEQQQRGTKI